MAERSGYRYSAGYESSASAQRGRLLPPHNDYSRASAEGQGDASEGALMGEWQKARWGSIFTQAIRRMISAVEYGGNPVAVDPEACSAKMRRKKGLVYIKFERLSGRP